MISLVIFAIIIIVAGVFLTTWLEKQKSPKAFESTDTVVEPASSCSGSCTECECSSQQVSLPQAEIQIEQSVPIVTPVVEPAPAVVSEIAPAPVVIKEEEEKIVPEKPTKKKRGRKPKKK
jgi:hypothetical protein